jgi:N-methylhydantoinase A
MVASLFSSIGPLMSHPSSATLVGVDVGGTFTDVVRVVDGTVRVHKEATTPIQHEGVVRGLDAMGTPPDAQVAHGTTAATNALLERRGARTALLTTRGFEDVLAIGRQDRPYLYRLRQERPPPLVPHARRFGATERLAADGTVLTPIDGATLRDVAERLAEQNVESLAIVFLFSFQNPAHERHAAQRIREYLPDLPITLSSDLLPEYREYERTATTVVNAYVQPTVSRYVDRLDEALGPRSVRVMQSNGGTIGLAPAAREAARLVLSGPAAGVVGAFGLARRVLETNAPRLMTLDMGGTSTDVALCDGAVPRTAEHAMAGLPLRLPAVDIHTVGAGGGSIARVDAGGSLRVGPASAGATPGPACYGKGGTRPTVTDAHLVLGRLHPDHFLGGSTALDPEAARRALETLADPLHTSVEAAARGVLRVANATMERALRRVSVERGHDPREHVLMPFGGAGPLHACALARALGIQRILVPPTPGVLSALGLLMADVVHDAAQSILQPAAALRDDPAPLIATADALATSLRDALPDDEALTFDAEIDARYIGQSYELTVPLGMPITGERVADAAVRFHEAHRQRYGHAMPDEPVEVVTLRLRGTRPGATIDLPRAPRTEASLKAARLGTHPIWFDAEAPTQTPCYDRAALHHGHRFDGPAAIYQYDTTMVIPEGWHARVDAWRNLRVEKLQ